MFSDIFSAFDLVDHTILQQKLRVYLNNFSVVPFFRSYLSDRSQYVCANGKLSVVGTMQSSVPQGRVLRTLLFVSIFINDLPLHIQEKTLNLSVCRRFVSGHKCENCKGNRIDVTEKSQRSV